MMILQFNKQTNDPGLGLPRRQVTARWVMLVLTLLAAVPVSAQSLLATNAPGGPALPGSAAVAGSLFRVLGALAIVLAVFFGGVWLFRHWQRTVIAKGHAPKLNILETKSLGQRHALYVVGYEQQRLLIAVSPAGVTMLVALPVVTLEATAEVPANKTTFTDALRQALHRPP